MAQLIQAFDANQFDPTQGVGGLPIGKHPVIVESSEVKPNKDNTGGYLQLNLKIIDGPQTGTVGAYRLNLYHSNQQTVEIAHKQLSAICHVTGQFRIQDSAQLHNIPFLVEVGPQKNDAQYTEVKKVFDINGNEPGKAGQGQAPAQPMQQPQNNPVGGFGSTAPNPQQGFAQQPAQAPAAWGQQQQQQPPAAAPQQPQGAPAWGQPQQPAQAPAAQQQAPANWQQNAAAPASGAAPWGQPR